MSSIRPPRDLDPSRLETAYPFSVLAPQSWAMATGEGVGVAVIDTGIDGALPDFADENGDSRVVAAVVTNPDAKTAADTYGHGTHVAGIIAGDSGRRDVVDPAWAKYIGIAPRANLIAIKASDDEGRGTILDAIYGLQFAVDHKDEFNIRVVNLSLSSTVAESYKTDPLDAAVESAYFHGILVVAAAGNRGAAADATAYAPANDPFALSVGAVDDQGTAERTDDATAEWSSAGVTQDGFAKPEIAAPGAHMVSTLARRQRVRRDVPELRGRQRVHPPRRHLDGGAGGVGGRGAAVPAASGLDARAGQGDAGRDRPRRLRRDRRGQRRGRTRRGTSRDGRRREHRAEHADRRDDRRDRLHAVELGSLQLGPFELGRRRMGPLELGLHVRGLAGRRARDDALELGRRGLAGPMGVLMQRASWVVSVTGGPAGHPHELLRDGH